MVNFNLGNSLSEKQEAAENTAQKFFQMLLPFLLILNSVAQSLYW